MHDIYGGSIFLVACWWFWHARNKLFLVNEVVSSYTLKLIIRNYDNLLAKYFIKHILSHPMRTITWNAHQYSNMILNIDGSSVGNPASQNLVDWFEMLMVLECTILQVILIIPTSFMMTQWPDGAITWYIISNPTIRDKWILLSYHLNHLYWTKWIIKLKKKR